MAYFIIPIQSFSNELNEYFDTNSDEYIADVRSKLIIEQISIEIINHKSKQLTLELGRTSSFSVLTTLSSP